MRNDNPYQNDRKSVRQDAGMLARIARSDKSLLQPPQPAAQPQPDHV